MPSPDKDPVLSIEKKRNQQILENKRKLASVGLEQTAKDFVEASAKQAIRRPRAVIDHSASRIQPSRRARTSRSLQESPVLITKTRPIYKLPPAPFTDSLELLGSVCELEFSNMSGLQQGRRCFLNEFQTYIIHATISKNAFQ